LEVLSLAKTEVTGRGLAPLAPLGSLRVLNLGYLPIRDDDLRNLPPHLEILALGYTQVTDAGLAHLRPISKLRVLNLDATAVTGTGFEELVGLTELRMLYVRQCKVESEHISKLDSELPGLAIYD
jgi:hypothetical protein